MTLQPDWYEMQIQNRKTLFSKGEEIRVGGFTFFFIDKQLQIPKGYEV